MEAWISVFIVILVLLIILGAIFGPRAYAVYYSSPSPTWTGLGIGLGFTNVNNVNNVNTVKSVTGVDKNGKPSVRTTTKK